ncbi:uncharacterized protein LOC126561102 [Anopheles maculipalpis]|uniref:uncharacterized protein LOC126561102 n=1 Tax=Anopheles maculipalpis TaxID=1496333 RepID=UPI0021596B49|nr:uncharacterized protein LOC126561102 [Anopheles maculipalpis]
MKLLSWLIVVCATFAPSLGSFVECDLDLEDPAIISRLPEQCQNVDDATKSLMIEESASFKLFHQKLLEYEASQVPASEDAVHMDMDFRNELYAAGDLHECLSLNDTLNQYLRCVMDKRNKMLEIVEQAGSL